MKTVFPTFILGERIAFDTGTEFGTIPGVVEEVVTFEGATPAWQHTKARIRLETSYILDGAQVFFVTVAAETIQLHENAIVRATITPEKSP